MSPATTARYRCTHCGNLTRFDVTVTRRSRSYHHYTVGGDLEIEETEVLSEDIEAVECRWCGTGKDVVTLDGEAPAESQIDSGR
jgi:hypothetical protein